MAVGARLRQRLVTAGLLSEAAYATTKVATGFARPRMSQLRRLDCRPPQFLPWLEDASVHHARDLAVFGLMSL